MQERILHRNAAAEYYTDERCHINELSNIADDAAVSIAQARVAPGVTTRWHRLRDTVERYVVLAGQLTAQEVGAGDVVLIPAGCRQRITNIGQQDLLFLAICSPRFQFHNYEDIDEQLL
jgi:mannose-6-phosphate isomerase-like protein (cupin superfamily)